MGKSISAFLFYSPFLGWFTTLIVFAKFYILFMCTNCADNWMTTITVSRVVNIITTTLSAKHITSFWSSSFNSEHSRILGFTFIIFIQLCQDFSYLASLSLVFVIFGRVWFGVLIRKSVEINPNLELCQIQRVENVGTHQNWGAISADFQCLICVPYTWT